MLRQPRQRRWDLCPPATQSVSAFSSEFSTLCRHSAVGVCMPRLPSISSSCWLSWLVSCEEHQAHAWATLGVKTLWGIRPSNCWQFLMFSTRPFMLSPMLSPATSLGAINRKFHQVPIGLSSVLAAPSLSFCYYMYIIITLTPSSSPNYRRHISLNNRHHHPGWNYELWKWMNPAKL